MSHARNVATWHPERTGFTRTQRLCKI